MNIEFRSGEEDQLEGFEQGNTREDHTRNIEAEEDDFLDEQEDDGE